MYLHFDFDSFDSETLPPELAVFVGSKENALENLYYLNGIPILDINNGTGCIKDVKNINLFIGTNNSGKSRFLRSLLKIEKFSISENLLTPLAHFSNVKNRVDLLDLVYGDYVKDFFDYWRGMVGIVDRLHLIDSKENELKKLKESYTHFEKLTYKESNVHYKRYLELVDDTFNFIEKLKFQKRNNFKEKYYIPIFRTLISGQNLGSNVYSEIIKQKYSIHKNVYTGLDLFNNIYELHTSPKIRELRKFALWIKGNFYPEHEIEIIPDKKSLNIHIDIDGKLRPVYDLGDGVQQLILMMFPIYTAEKGTWFFIEEPEMHLHPGLQRIFMEALLENEHIKDKNLKFFFTTHSNHFLDISINHDEVSIFQFEKESDEQFNIKSNIKPNKEVFDLLGVNSSSVFLANASIWVEGPTDRRYISKWLKLYCEHNNIKYLREDIDFAFFEYGGNLIEHYLFDEDFEEDLNENQVREKIKSFSLSNKVYLLADNDNVEPGSAKQKRREKLQNIKGSNFYYQNTEYKEIENLLPVKILNDFLPQLVNNPGASKIDEINFSREDYYQIGLGEFITELFSKSKIKGKSFKSKTEDTLSSPYKTKLCDFVVNTDYKYSDLIHDNDHLDKIITDLYNFIKAK